MRDNKKSFPLSIILISVLSLIIACFFYINKNTANIQKEIPSLEGKGLADKAIKGEKKQDKNIKKEDRKGGSALSEEESLKPLPLVHVHTKARASYIAAAKEARDGAPEKAVENLHDAFKIEPGLINNVLIDQNFRSLRKHPHFEKLLKILGRDIYKDLGKPPIELVK